MTPDVYSLLGIVLIIAILAIAWFYFNKRKEVLTAIAYFVQVAENKFGAGQGEIKYQYVVERIYPMLPESIKFFFTSSQLDKWITKAVDDLQDKINSEIDKQ